MFKIIGVRNKIAAASILREYFMDARTDLVKDGICIETASATAAEIEDALIDADISYLDVQSI